MNPSTAELLEAVEAVGSDQVVVLPNNKNILPVAEQVDGLSDKTVRVVATGSIVEGFAALLAYDPGAGRGRNGAAMAASACHVVPAEVTQAVRDSDDRRRPGAGGRLDRPVARRRRRRSPARRPARRGSARARCSAPSTSWSP